MKLLEANYADPAGTWRWLKNEAEFSLVHMCHHDHIIGHLHALLGGHHPLSTFLLVFIIRCVTFRLMTLLWWVVTLILVCVFFFLLSKVALWHCLGIAQRGVQIVSYATHCQCSPCYVHMSPIVVSESIYLLCHLMSWEINHFFANEAHLVFVLEQMNLLLIVHHEETLGHFFFQIICGVLTIWLKSDKPSWGQLIDFFGADLITFCWMEFDLKDLVDFATTLSKVNSLVVTSHKMSSDHVLRLTDQFEEGSV